MKDIESLLKELTLEEKASLCCGAGFWNTTPIERFNIPALNLTDGPHGLRKQPNAADHLGIAESAKTTCFPTAAGMASSWNRELMGKIGAALAKECHAEDVQVILGPGANIKRSPLCGRNFEYFSEDPYLSGEMAAAHINGVQNGGIGSSLKHFAVNNQETKRFNIDAVVDERTLREIYLASFEIAVKKAKPRTVMCSYNKTNGEFNAQNKKLLTDILKDEWGYDGVVVSDWFATCERDLGLLAGLDLEMPASAGIGEEKIIKAVKNGKISKEVLDDSVRRLLLMVERSIAGHKDGVTYSKEKHHELARQAARECMVLLKNEDNILPLKKGQKVAVLGEFAKSPRFQGVGSSRINTTFVDIPYEEISKKDITLVENPKDAETCIIFAGLPAEFDSEGSDRKHLRLPDEQIKLISDTTTVCKNVVVVLSNGSAVEMPWLSAVKGILECYLAGQGFGAAIADILCGDANPSGKLAETFPARLEDTPCYLNFPGDSKKVEYREGIFVGYRYYDSADVKTLFSFGFGLSYTAFEYSGLKMSTDKIRDDENLTVTVKVKNIGKVAGAEIVQLYVTDKKSDIIRPEKELKGFEKVTLAPSEEQEVCFSLDKRSLAYYDVDMADWCVESGEFGILIGKSSAEIVLSESVYVESTTKFKKNYTLDSTIYDVKDEPAAASIVQMMTANFEGDSAGVGMSVDALLSSMKLRSLVATAKARGREGVSEESIKSLIKMMNGED